MWQSEMALDKRLNVLAPLEEKKEQKSWGRSHRNRAGRQKG